MNVVRACCMLVGLTALFVTAQDNAEKLPDGIYASIETNRGTIELELFHKETPKTVANFVKLTEKKFYDGLSWHRVIPNFMIQGGCPEGTGRGGPGYAFGDEIVPSLKHSGPGILSMANSGPNTNGSQFFITHKATPWLDGKHTVFGKIRGDSMDVVNAIKGGDSMKKVTIKRVGEALQSFAMPGSEVKDAKAAFAKLIETKYPKAEKSESGLHWIVNKKGDGTKPKKGDMISVHYTGTFVDGGKFDSSVDRGEPIEFPVGTRRVIPGWDEGLLDMSVGEKRTLIIPYNLAYGERGRRPVIPGFATLIFEVKLISIK